MTNIKLIAFGFIPFLLGWAMDFVTRLHDYSVALPVLFISGGTICIWAVAAFLFSRQGILMRKVVLLMNLVAFVDLVLLGVQELFIGYNAIGIWTQYFYMPVMMPGVMLLWMVPISLFAIYCVCFVTLLIASFVGCKCYKKCKK